LSGALYSWLLRWNCRTSLCPNSSPVLSQAVLSSGTGADDDPAHLTLSVPLPLSTGRQNAHWLLAESSWPGLFHAPRFLDLARWIWKVSTCLLVMQFVIPLRRNLRQARSKSPDPATEKSSRPTKRSRFGHIAVAVCYLVLMCVAGMLSVLLSILLFALAVAAKLPIPRIELAVRWVVVKISSVLGDSYVLAHCPVQFAAMRTKVAHDLQWLQERCGKVAIVAHSQGAAIAHQVLKEGGYQRGLRAFITLGQGIGKMHMLWHMDWDPKVHRVSWWSRLLVTAGMACAGFPALAVLVSRRLRWPVFTIPAAIPWNITMITGGLLVVIFGVFLATHAVGPEVEEDVRLPGACSQFPWIDYFASADPVSNGPLSRSPENRECTEPTPCNEVYNFRSLLADHNGYLRNQDELLSKLLNDLVAAAYGDKAAHGQHGPWLVRTKDLETASTRRRHRAAWLVCFRVLTVLFGIFQFIYLPMRSVQDPVRRLVLKILPHTQIDNTLVRLVIALTFMTVIYLTVLLFWRLGDGRAMLRFLRTTPHCVKPAGSHLENAEAAQGERIRDDAVAAAVRD
jgi:hypothetical protein